MLEAAHELDHGDDVELLFNQFFTTVNECLLDILPEAAGTTADFLHRALPPDVHCLTGGDADAAGSAAVLPACSLIGLYSEQFSGVEHEELELGGAAHEDRTDEEKGFLDAAKILEQLQEAVDGSLVLLRSAAEAEISHEEVSLTVSGHCRTEVHVSSVADVKEFLFRLSNVELPEAVFGDDSVRADVDHFELSALTIKCEIAQIFEVRPDGIPVVDAPVDLALDGGHLPEVIIELVWELIRKRTFSGEGPEDGGRLGASRVRHQEGVSPVVDAHHRVGSVFLEAVVVLDEIILFKVLPRADPEASLVNRGLVDLIGGAESHREVLPSNVDRRSSDCVQLVLVQD